MSSDTIKIKESDLIQSLINFEGSPVSFKNYVMSRIILDTEYDSLVFKGGRQVSKSMTFSLHNIATLAGTKYYKILYLAPSLPQVTAYSRERFEARINESPDFKRMFVDKTCTQNVYEKSFTNLSRIYFRSCGQLENTRGLSVNEVFFDEIQDISVEAIEIVEQSRSGKIMRKDISAGTAKSELNILERRWRDSSQIVPLIKCPSGHHNIPDLDNISKSGVICKKCKTKLILDSDHITPYVTHPDRKFTVGFWVPQIILPHNVYVTRNWEEIWHRYNTYETSRFLNEVMGISSGTGISGLSEEDLKRACLKYDIQENSAMFASRFSTIYAGIDWAATNTKSFNCITIAGWDAYDNTLKVLYIKKYVGKDFVQMIYDMANIIKTFAASVVVCDWGLGWLASQQLSAVLDNSPPVTSVQYVAIKQPFMFDNISKGYKANRSSTMSSTIAAIQRGTIRFFRWEDFQQFSPHFLAVVAELSVDNQGNETLRYFHAEDEPDDIFHTVNLIWSIHKYRYGIEF